MVGDKTKLDEIKEENEIIEGEVTEDSPLRPDSAKTMTGEQGFEGQAGQAATFLNLEELIKNHIEALDKLREEFKEKREMFEDTFNNSPQYRELVDKVKEANKARSSLRQELSKQPSVAKLKQEVDDLKFDISEKGKTLSDLLQDFREQTGATQIEARDGRIFAIVSISKLVVRK